MSNISIWGRRFWSRFVPPSHIIKPEKSERECRILTWRFGIEKRGAVWGKSFWCVRMAIFGFFWLCRELDRESSIGLSINTLLPEITSSSSLQRRLCIKICVSLELICPPSILPFNLQAYLKSTKFPFFCKKLKGNNKSLAFIELFWSSLFSQALIILHPQHPQNLLRTKTNWFSLCL